MRKSDLIRLFAFGVGITLLGTSQQAQTLVIVIHDEGDPTARPFDE